MTRIVPAILLNIRSRRPPRLFILDLASAGLIYLDPSAHGDELLLLQIDRDNVSSHRANASVWPICDRRGQTSGIVVKSLENVDQLFTTYIFACNLQRLCKNLESAINRNQGCCMI